MLTTNGSLRVFKAIVVLSIAVGLVYAQQADFNSEEMNIPEAKCELCKTAVKILFKEIDRTDPKKKIEVGSFRLNADGSSSQKAVVYKGSEFQLEDLLDDNLVCSKLQDIVPVTDKFSGALKMMNMVEEMDKIDTIKFFTNADMNSKMNTLCQEMFGDHEEELVELFRKRKEAVSTPFKLARIFCHEQTQVCPDRSKLDELRTENDDDVPEDNQEEIDELKQWDYEGIRDEL